MLKTNRDKLVMISIQGKISNPSKRQSFLINFKGESMVLPQTGGITYNVRVGDPASGWAGDHIEPGVSTILDQEKRFDPPNRGYNILACVGNTAKVVSGDAKGKRGIVTGHHGGAEHVIIDFDDETLEDLTLEDKILIKSFGQGLVLLDYPDIKVYNLDPDLLLKMGIEGNGDGTITVPVKTEVPGMLMGSGLGSTDMGSGDYDITLSDEEVVAKYNLKDLCLGDFVAIMNHDNTYGRSYKEGAVTIGIVIHGDCELAGHGPGVTTLITSRQPLIKTRIDENANIAKIMKIGRYRD